jgi:hypothetical protein
MTAVLCGSRKPGSTGKVAVRHARTICVRGMQEGDLICITYHSDLSITDDIIDNFERAIPEGTEFVSAHHTRASGSRVFIDLR